MVKTIIKTNDGNFKNVESNKVYNNWIGNHKYRNYHDNNDNNI